MSRRASIAFGFALYALVSVSSTARAQAPREGFRLDRFAAPPTSHDGFLLTLPAVLGHLEPAAQLVTHYALAPFLLRTTDDDALVEHKLGLDVVFALGLFDLLEIYGRLPLVLAMEGEEATFELTRYTPPSGAALSDLAAGASLRMFERRGFVLGGRVEVITPSGSRKKLAGDGAVEPRAELLASYAWERLLFALSAGGILRPRRDFANAQIGPEVSWGAALRVRLDRSLDVFLEGAGIIGLAERDAPGAADGMELSFGARHRQKARRVALSIGSAVGAGLSDLAGEPAFRALVNVGVERWGSAPDDQEAPTAAPDSDRDGVADGPDLCPHDGEDADGHLDEDGCPDPDDDGDGVRDDVDACPRVAGSARNGCPTEDLDEDGVLDRRDRCPRDPEDRDGDRDEDGCPDKDSDGDGLTDDLDACPDVPGLKDRQGCLAHAKLERERITLLEPITFDDTNVLLSAKSAPVLDDVAALLRARAQLAAELIVHVPARGNRARAAAVGAARRSLLLQALVGRDVPRTRLEACVRIESEPQGVDGVEVLVRALPASGEVPPPSVCNASKQP